MTEMLAGRLHVGERAFRLETVPIPDPGRGEVRIKVAAAGVCLSDVHLIDGTLRPLFLDGDVVTLGHEVAGTIDAVGEDADGWQLGQRVLLQAGEEDPDGRVLTRGVDYDGGWAEYTVAAQQTVVAIPDDLPFEQACIIPDAVSTPYAAVVSTGQIRPAEAVAVWGVGGLGVHGVKVLRLVGAAPIIAVDPNAAARERAMAFGADVAFDPAATTFRDDVMALTGGRGVDAAFDFAGVPQVRPQAISVLARDGRLVIVGLANQAVTIPYDTLFTYFRQSVLGHYGSEPTHVEQLVRLARAHRLDLASSITDVLPLADAEAVVQRLESKEGDPIRLILRP